MTKTPYQIPFQLSHDGHVHMLEYTWTGDRNVSWRDNSTFQADLQLIGCYRGRSAARVRVKNLGNGEEYSMGFGAFFDTITKRDVIKGKVSGKWTFRKQGSNYGLVPVLEK